MAWRSAGLDDHQAVALGIPQPEQRRHRVAQAADLGIDIDAFHAELKAAGVDVDPEVSRMGDPVPPLLFLRDPEGNSLMVVEAR